MMTSSLLQLEHYFVAEAHCKARPEFPASNRDPLAPPDANFFDTEVKVFRDEEDSLAFRIQLVVKTRPNADAELPYEVLVHIVGDFHVGPDFNHNRLEHLVRINGASVLYSAARDFLLTLTSRGPWGPLLLPTVNFRVGNGESGSRAAEAE